VDSSSSHAREINADSQLELADADDRQHASALRAFLAVAEEKVAVAGSAEAADEYVWGTEAGD